jgi:hypothetical protein
MVTHEKLSFSHSALGVWRGNNNGWRNVIMSMKTNYVCQRRRNLQMSRFYIEALSSSAWQQKKNGYEALWENWQWRSEAAKHFCVMLQQACVAS